MENIIEGNKLIAEFMGLNYDIDVFGYCTNELYQSGYRNQNYINNDLNWKCYHSSWDWLMPVVEKIKGLVCESEFTNRIGYNLHYEQDKYKLFISCIEFIKWYNQNKH